MTNLHKQIYVKLNEEELKVSGQTDGQMKVNSIILSPPSKDKSMCKTEVHPIHIVSTNLLHHCLSVCVCISNVNHVYDVCCGCEINNTRPCRVSLSFFFSECFPCNSRPFS